jgi:hypothetical protein
MTTLRRVRAGLNPTIDVDGVLLTMYDERTNLGAQVAANVREFFKEKVFNTVIPRNVRLAEAPSHGLPVTVYDAKSRGAESYVALARELMDRHDAKRASTNSGATAAPIKVAEPEEHAGVPEQHEPTESQETAESQVRTEQQESTELRESTEEIHHGDTETRRSE